ncbi:TPA: glycosyltransferase [Staphylococcus delphini]|nr:glycosyltransferase [Staphylococcus delphini]
MFYTITSTLPEFHGGRTKALLKRIMFMEANFDESHIILTTNYNPNYPLVLERFKDRKILSHQTKVLNIYEWYTNGENFCFPHSKFRKKKIYNKTPVHINGLTHQSNKKDANIIRYYKEDQYVLYRKYYDVNSEILQFEDFMLPSQKHKAERREYNEYGYLHRIIMYDKKKNTKLSERLYNQDGQIYCVRHFTNNKVSHIALYKNNTIVHTFDNEGDFFTYFYENVIEDDAIVFNDARLLDDAILNVKKSLKNVFVIHSSHKTIDGNIKGRYRLLYNRAEEIDQIVVLTPHQKEEMMEDFGISGTRLTVIPHFSTIYEVQENDRYPKFLYLGRIDENKQVSHILQAFKRYKDAGYDYGLNIYGYGDPQDIKNMKNEISNLNLHKHVKFHGKTDEPETIFRQHAASILASQFEGFALSVMESVNNGCPVLSYDIRYGPRDLIVEGENGHLVESQNIEDLAEKMKRITEYPITNVKLDGRFSIEQAKKNYKALIEKLVQ